MLEPKQLYKRIEAVFDGLEPRGSAEQFASRMVPRVLDQLGRPLGLTTAHLYRREDAAVRLVQRWGPGRPDLGAELTRRIVTEATRDIPELPWAGETAGGRAGLVPASEDDAFLMALFLAPPGELQGAPSPSQLGSALTSLHYAFSQHHKRRELEDLFAQARAIQLSLLPDGRPSFAGFDIAAVSIPAQSVGGGEDPDPMGTGGPGGSDAGREGPGPVRDPVACQLSPGIVGMPPVGSRARVTHRSQESVGVQCTLSRSTYEKLRYAGELLGHPGVAGDLALILDGVLEAAIPRLERRKLAATDRPRAAPQLHAGQPPHPGRGAARGLASG